MKRVIMENSVLGSTPQWGEYCESVGDPASIDFEKFRRHPVMVSGVEGTNIRSSFQNIRFFRKNKTHIVSRTLSKISSSDCVGKPINSFTFFHDRKWLAMNPTTLRYAKNWANIIDLFPVITQSSSLTISEIGAGYGGDAKVFFDLYSTGEFKKSYIEYNVYDLATSIQMIKRFLGEFGYKVNFKSAEEDQPIADHSHLVISNGAISEMRGELLDIYFKNVVSKADYGYFIVNFDTHSKPYEGGINNDEFFELLSAAGKNPIWLDENKFLTNFDKGASKCITFGSTKNNVDEAYKSRDMSILNKIFSSLILQFSVEELGIKKLLKIFIKKILG